LVKDFLAKNNLTTLNHPHTFLNWLQLIFNCSLHRNWKGRDGPATDVIKNATERAFTNILPEMFPALLNTLAEVCICTRGLFGRKYILNGSTVLHVSEIK
jgi:hypothetical protein